VKLLSKTGEELARVDVQSGKGEPLSAKVTMGDMVIESPEVEMSLEKVGEDLVAHVRIPGMVNFAVAVEPADVGALKGMMSKDVLKFMMGAFFR